MLGIKCKQCSNKFTVAHILVGDGGCVFCYYGTDKFYYNGDLLSRQEAIERNRELENLISKFRRRIK